MSNGYRRSHRRQRHLRAFGGLGLGTPGAKEAEYSNARVIAATNRELSRSVSHISAEVMSCLQRHPWPGNVRELENVLTKGVALSHSNTR